MSKRRHLRLVDGQDEPPKPIHVTITLTPEANALLSAYVFVKEAGSKSKMARAIVEHFLELWAKDNPEARIMAETIRQGKEP